MPAFRVFWCVRIQNGASFQGLVCVGGWRTRGVSPGWYAAPRWGWEAGTRTGLSAPRWGLVAEWVLRQGWSGARWRRMGCAVAGRGFRAPRWGAGCCWGGFPKGCTLGFHRWPRWGPGMWGRGLGGRGGEVPGGLLGRGLFRPYRAGRLMGGATQGCTLGFHRWRRWGPGEGGIG